MSFRNLVCLLVLLPLMMACRKEQPDSEKNDVQVQVKLKLKSGSSETEVRSLRLMLFDNNDEARPSIYNKAFVPSEVYDAPSQSYILNVKINRKNAMQLSVIANEKAAWNLADTTVSIKHKDLLSKYSKCDDPTGTYSLVEAPFVMFCDASVVIGAEEGPVVERHYELVRQVAKLTFNLRFLKDLDLKFSKISVVSLPQYNALAPHLNTCNSAFVAVHLPTEPVELNTAAFTLKGDYYEMDQPVVVYLPEHLFDHTADAQTLSKYTYIRLEATKDGQLHVYNIPMGEHVNKLYRETNPLTFDQLKGEDFCIYRNTHFIYKTTINHFGIKIEYEVKPWTQVDIDIPIGSPHLNMSTLVNTMYFSGTMNALKTTPANFLFWSNMPSKEIYIDSMLVDNLGSLYRVKDIFDVNLDYVGAAGSKITSGTLSLKIKNTQGLFANVNVKSYTFNFWAGNLKRSLTVQVKHFPVFKMDVPFVGIAYTNEQQGERVIYYHHSGPWSATVEYPTNNISGQFVKLSDIISPDEQIWTADPMDAELLIVKDGVQTVNGSGNIYFRVGLDGKNNANPPRYAKIILTHSGGTQDIYVRQGENKDYLMRPNDLITGGGDRSDLSGKPMATNVTMADFGYMNGIRVNTEDLPILAQRTSETTAFFMWNNREDYVSSYLYYTHAHLGSYDAGTREYGTGPWLSRGDVSPTDSQVSIDVMRGSLLKDTAANPTEKNYSWGMVADGMMDRYERLPLNTTDVNGTSHQILAATDVFGSTKARTLPGMLFFNTANDSYASVFLPMQGRRVGKNVAVEQVGLAGYYWSRSKVAGEKKIFALKLYYLNGVSYVETEKDVNPNVNVYNVRSFEYHGQN